MTSGWERQRVSLASGDSFTLGELAGSWTAHVSRLHAELDAPDSDMTTWGVFDVVAALVIRDRLADGVSQLPPEQVAQAEAKIGHVDRMYRDMTSDDPDREMARATDSSDREAWWWGRKLSRGPVARELAELLSGSGADQNPWERFDRALTSSDDQAAELRRVLEEVDRDELEEFPDRQELRECALAVLAEMGEVPLSAALAERSRADVPHNPGWPDLYLAHAATAQGFPDVALRCVAQVPSGYFDRLDLHWRTVELARLKAQAHVRLGEFEIADPLIRKLNDEYRRESLEDVYPSPAALVQLLLEPRVPVALLASLVQFLDLHEWFDDKLASAIANRVGSGQPDSQ